MKQTHKLLTPQCRAAEPQSVGLQADMATANNQNFSREGLPTYK